MVKSDSAVVKGRQVPLFFPNLLLTTVLKCRLFLRFLTMQKNKKVYFFDLKVKKQKKFYTDSCKIFRLFFFVFAEDIYFCSKFSKVNVSIQKMKKQNRSVVNAQCLKTDLRRQKWGFSVFERLDDTTGYIFVGKKKKKKSLVKKFFSLENFCWTFLCLLYNLVKL